MNSYVDGWVNLLRNEVDEEALMAEYTCKGRDGDVIPLYQLTENFLRLPWSAEGKFKHLGISDYRNSGRDLWEHGPVFGEKFEYRKGQESAVQDMFAHLKEHKSGVLHAATGKGKTVMGAALAAMLGKTTCVLIHKEFLYEQWCRAFELVCPSLKVGLMQRDRVDTGEDYDVVCAITQSVTNPRREYPEDFYSSFGALFCDEVHRYGAAVWQNAITRFSAMIRLGMTATPKRGDGFWPVLDHHIGKIAVSLTEPDLFPIVYQIETHIDIEEKLYSGDWLNDTQMRAKLLTILATHEARNEVLVRNILKAWESNRRSLVISDRKVQLEMLAKMLKRRGISDSKIGFYIGGKKQAALNEAAKKRIIFGTYGMASEGLDIPELDVVFFGTPRGNIKQVVGRILRLLPGKKQPVVFDLVDEKIPLLQSSAEGRLWQYRSLNFQVVAA